MATFDAIELVLPDPFAETLGYSSPSVVEMFPVGGATDTTSPTITIVDPPPNTTITPSTAIQFTVSDDNALQTVILMAKYPSPPNRPTEVIWDGSAFKFPFLASSVVATPTEYQFVVRRSNGWQASPTIDIFAVDSAGNEPV